MLRKASGFTLIELLVVIAIIAILAGLAFPAVQGALGGGRKAQARNDVQQIAAAVRAFELEYGRQPSTETTTDTWLDDNSVLMKILLGEDPALNPRNKRFLEPKLTTSEKGGINSSTKVFYDPWGKQYGIKLNTDYDNNIEYYGSNAVSVIVLSFGPDGEQGDPSGTAKVDDIFNYR
jgi:prepilin-type N-terminal cleavage/methylation domain-containing protein